MNIFDIIIIIIIAFFSLKGLKNGLIKELGIVVGLILGIYVSVRFSYYIEDIFKEKSNLASEYLPIISHGLTFIIVMILIMLLSNFLTRFMKIIQLQWLNRLAGTVLGLIKIILILGVLFFFLIKIDLKINFLSNTGIKESLLFNKIYLLFESIFPYVEQFKIENEKVLLNIY